MIGKEIERKFLVIKEKWKPEVEAVSIKQGYLLGGDQLTIRIRTINEQGYLTIKGPSKGIMRQEFEYEIPAEDAKELLTEFCKNLVVKKRYVVFYEDKKWEVDEFLEQNAGLMVAEVELKDENELPSLPGWAGKEVSDDPRYFNSYLSEHPFSTWK